MIKIQLTHEVRRQEMVVRVGNGESTELKVTFELPKGQKALVGVKKQHISAPPAGFVEASKGGFYFVYLKGTGAVESFELEVKVSEGPVRRVPFFLRLWEGNGPLNAEIENASQLNQIAIIGGCCTRDTFELESTLSVSEYRARTSFAGMASPGVAYLPEEVFNRVPSAFQRRMVRGDILKESLRAVVLASGRHVVVDFMIEKRDLFYSGESIITWSDEFSKLGILPEELPGEYRPIDKNSEEYYALFRKGWKYAVQHLSAARKKVVVNEIKWASHNEKGEAFALEEVLEANRRLERLYEIVRTETPEVDWITYDPDVFVGDSEHKWGPAPVHFQKKFYQEQLVQIEKIVNDD